jgi:type II secretory pathway component PulF
MTLFSPQADTKSLADLCHRLSMAFDAGIDARTIWAREAERAHGRLHQHLATVSDAVNHGEAMAEALSKTGDFFPTLFREMVGLGEQTGRVDAVLAQLADHYQNQITLRRNFWSSITWPLAQLGIAVGVVGLLIWVQGLIGVDILGFGVAGNRGLTLYAMFLAAVGAALFLLLRALSRGLVWTAPIQRIVLQLPGIGKPLQTVALARLAWAMHVTLDGGMEVRQALRLSLRSTHNARYIDHIPAIVSEISAGKSIHEAFCRAGGYPAEFLDTLAVGEQSGKIAESMGVLARQYQERARVALATLTMLAGWAVWAVIAALLIALIIRVFSFYLNAVTGALKQV